MWVFISWEKQGVRGMIHRITVCEDEYSKIKYGSDIVQLAKEIASE